MVNNETSAPQESLKNYQVIGEIKKIFWECPAEALFCREEISIITGYSTSWLCKTPPSKGGIPFLKGPRRRCLYRKADVAEWIKGFKHYHVKPG